MCIRDRPQVKLNEIAEAISSLHTKVKLCPKTFALISDGEDVSKLYADERRDRKLIMVVEQPFDICLLYTSPSPRDRTRSRMPSSA